MIERLRRKLRRQGSCSSRSQIASAERPLGKTKVAQMRGREPGRRSADSEAGALAWMMVQGPGPNGAVLQSHRGREQQKAGGLHWWSSRPGRQASRARR